MASSITEVGARLVPGSCRVTRIWVSVRASVPIASSRATFSGRSGARCPLSTRGATTASTEKEQAIEFEGEITEALPNTFFRVEIDGGHVVLAKLAGRMRRNYIRVNPGDRVKVEVSPYDLTRGRITYRLK